jgi:diguanylate cyclase (GGDEF)-like protein/PAS domain S-box-containing protein
MKKMSKRPTISKIIQGNMFDYVSKYFRVLGFERYEDQYKADMLIAVLWAAIAANIVFAFIVVEWARSNFTSFLIIWMSLFVIAFTTLYLLHKKRLRTASWFLLSATWGMITVVTVVLAGFNFAGYFALLVTLAAGATLLLGNREALVFIVLSGSTVVLWFLSVEGNWFVNKAAERNILATMVVPNVLNLVIMAVLLFFANQGVRRAYIQVRESERKYQTLYDYSNDAIFIYGLDLTTISMNREAERILGYSESELIGKHISIIVPEHEREDSMNKINSILESDMVPIYERKLITKEGEEITVETNLTLVRKDDGTPECFQVVFRDISIREQARKELKDSEARYRNLFEESPISLWEEDFSEVRTYLNQLKASGIHDLRQYFDEKPEEVQHMGDLIKILDTNQATFDLYAHLPTEIFTNSLDIASSAEGIRFLKEEILALEDGQTRYEGETFHPGPDGDLVHTLVRVTIPSGHEKDWKRVIVSVIDITESKRQEEALMQSELQYRMTMDAFSDVVVVVDPDLKVVLANSAARVWFESLGFKKNLVGIRIFDINPLLQTSIEDDFQQIFSDKEPVVNEYTIQLHGFDRIMEVRLLPIFRDDHINLVIMAMRDVSDRKSLEDRLRISLANMANLSRTDPLTGLFNRRAMIEYAQAEISRAERNNTILSLLILDMDFLKTMNDKYGHQSGDMALKLLADTIQGSKRKYDWAGRWGGDEFLLILPDACLDDAGEVAKRLIERVRHTSIPIPGGKREFLSISVGVSCSRDNEKDLYDLDELLSRADQALYYAKQTGRDQCSLYGRDVTEKK